MQVFGETVRGDIKGAKNFQDWVQKVMINGWGVGQLTSSNAKSYRMDYLHNVGTICIILLSTATNLNKFYTKKVALHIINIKN
jgi:hypothetical protein